MPNSWKWMIRKALPLHFLNVDVVLAVLLTAGGVSRLLGCQLPWQQYALLGLATFTIYVIDRLIDAGSLPWRKTAIPKLHTARHLYYYANGQWLWPLVLLCVVAGLALAITWLPLIIWQLGLGLAGLTGLYLWLVPAKPVAHHALVGKETWVAVIYAGAVWLPVWLGCGMPYNGYFWVYFVLFLLATWQNLHFFYWLEPEGDAPASRLVYSAAVVNGIGLVGMVSTAIAGLYAGSSGAGMPAVLVAAALFAMFALHVWLLAWHSKHGRVRLLRSRFLADMSFGAVGVVFLG